MTNEMLQQRILELETALAQATSANPPTSGLGSSTGEIVIGNGAVGSSSGSGSSTAQGSAADELNAEYGQLILGDQPGSSRFFAQITPTYLHVSHLVKG